MPRTFQPSWRAAAVAALVTLGACGSTEEPFSGTPVPEPGGPYISVVTAPAYLVVQPGQSTQVLVTTTRGGGFSGPINLAVTGAPTGVTPTLAPPTIPAEATVSTLTLAASAAAPAGTYAVTVTGTGSGIGAQSTSIVYVIFPKP